MERDIITQGYCRLAGAILLAALRDATSKAKSKKYTAIAARKWLCGIDAGILFDGIGLPQERVIDWIESGEYQRTKIYNVRVTKIPLSVETEQNEIDETY